MKARSKSAVYSCAEYKQQLLTKFYTDISDDRKRIQPTSSVTAATVPPEGTQLQQQMVFLTNTVIVSL